MENFTRGLLIDGLLVCSVGILSIAGMTWLIWKCMSKLDMN